MWYPFELWILFLVFLIFYLQGCFRDSLDFLSCGADRNRNYLNYMGIKIFVSQSFTFCHFRINVIIVPIYLPNLEKSKGSLSMGRAFPVPLWLLPWACLLFHLCFWRTPCTLPPSAPPIFTCHLCVGRLVTASPVPQPQCGCKEHNRKKSFHITKLGDNITQKSLSLNTLMSYDALCLLGFFWVGNLSLLTVQTVTGPCVHFRVLPEPDHQVTAP